jgi:hypothetical protein
VLDGVGAGALVVVVAGRARVIVVGAARRDRVRQRGDEEKPRHQPACIRAQ